MRAGTSPTLPVCRDPKHLSLEPPTWSSLKFDHNFSCLPPSLLPTKEHQVTSPVREHLYWWKYIPIFTTFCGSQLQRPGYCLALKLPGTATFQLHQTAPLPALAQPPLGLKCLDLYDLTIFQGPALFTSLLHQKLSPGLFFGITHLIHWQSGKQHSRCHHHWVAARRKLSDVLSKSTEKTASLFVDNPLKEATTIISLWSSVFGRVALPRPTS